MIGTVEIKHDEDIAKMWIKEDPAIQVESRYGWQSAFSILVWRARNAGYTDLLFPLVKEKFRESSN